MTPIARQELHDFADRVRQRREREKEPRQPLTFADKWDAAVIAVCLIGGLVLAVMGL